MPHMHLEYSANLAMQTDIARLCDVAAQAMASCGLFEKSGIRVRAIGYPDFHVADGHETNSFLHIIMRIGSGRGAAAKKSAGDQIFAAIENELRGLLETPYFALSMEIVEIDAVLSWKRNSIRRRLDAGGP